MYSSGKVVVNDQAAYAAPAGILGQVVLSDQAGQDLQKEKKKFLAAGTRTPVPRVRVLYPNHLDYSELIGSEINLRIYKLAFAKQFHPLQPAQRRV